MRDSQPMIASKLELSPCAVSVLGQLFVEGPTSDDNITSRAGRCDLVSAGLAFHEAGLSSLTPDGARLAREWDLCSLYARRDRRRPPAFTAAKKVAASSWGRAGRARSGLGRGGVGM